MAAAAESREEGEMGGSMAAATEEATEEMVVEEREKEDGVVASVSRSRRESGTTAGVAGLKRGPKEM